MWNDFVIVGPASDPAGVLRRAPDDAAAAFEAIAAAGAAGRATLRVARRQVRHEHEGAGHLELTPGRAQRGQRARGAGAANPAWYHKAGLGMADTLRLTQQCPSAAAAATRSPTAARCSS